MNMMRNMEGMGPTGKRIELPPRPPRKDVEQKTEYNPKETYRKLTELMKKVSVEQNTELKSKFGAPADFIQEDGSISFESFSAGGGGDYSQGKIDEDRKFITGRMREWSGVEDPKTRSFRLDEYHIDKNLDPVKQDELIIKNFKEGKAKAESAKLEAAVSIIFHKILKSKFLVVRSAEPDDFKKGVDNVMINKETGEVICTFDEVSEPEGGVRIQEKIKKTGKKNTAFGSTIEYGLTFKKDEEGKTKVHQTELKNIPSFFVAVAPPELKNLLMNMEFDPSKPPSKIELQMFDRFISSLEAQAEGALQEGSGGPAQENIRRFMSSVDQIKQLRSQFE